MKTLSTIALVVFCAGLAYNQDAILTSGKLKIISWDKNTVILCSSEDGRDVLKIMALNRKSETSGVREKQLKINGEKYLLKQANGVFNMLDSDGKLVLKTSKDRNEVFIAGKTYERQLKPFDRSIRYVDPDGTQLVSGKIDENAIKLQCHDSKTEEKLLLLGIGLEELLQLAREQYLASASILQLR